MATIFTCAAGDDIFTMSKLISAGAEVNRVDSTGKTPLITAVIHGSIRAAKLLLSSGADPNYCTELFNETALHFAVQQGRKDIIILLFDAGADPTARNCDGEGPIFAAVRWANPHVISLLSDRGCNLTEINNIGQTPLAVACDFNSRPAVKALLDCGVTAETSGVSSSSVKALSTDFPQVSKKESLKRPITANSHRHNRKNTRKASTKGSTLFDIVSNNQVDELKMRMKEGIKVNEPANFNGETLIHAATLYGATECVEALIKAGANVNARTEFDQQSALHIAVREGYFDIFHMLIKAGAQIDAKDCDGETPLFVAVKCNRIDMFRVLTRKGADVNIANLGNLTPIKFAVLASNKFMVQALLYFGAKLDSEEFNPYMFSFKAEDVEIANLLQKKAPKLADETLLPKNIFQIIRENNVEELRNLITKGFKLDLVDNLEGAPLHCAVRYNAKECMDLLIEKGADVNVLDVQNRETPFMTAISSNEKIIPALIENPLVDMTSIKNKDGESSLFYAIRANNKTLVNELIQLGCDVNELNNSGLSPLYVAISLRFDDIAQLLMDNGADQASEVHPSLSLAMSMKDKKIIRMLAGTSTPNIVIPEPKTTRCESRKLRSSLRSASPSRNGKRSSVLSRPTTRSSSRASTSYRQDRTIRDAPDDGMCVVCHRNKATQQLIPCGHIPACHGCIKQFIENQEPCPICGLKFYATKTVCQEPHHHHHH